ncbi:MAG: CoA-acylating methylmalonate-semialdehyde dehydrogenase [Methylacidiphilales bacterium]|nr:CoA-acylating methylmalonate-semialdehyde dehydrogenase [Candidatus Methylacidiphilales bacterium]
MIISHFINGRLTEASEGQLPVCNPASGEIIKHVQKATPQDLNSALQYAKNAYTSWSELSPIARARVLFTFKSILDERIDELAKLITLEHGKTIDDAKGEITRGIEVVEYACGIPYLLRGNHNQNIGREIDAWSIHQPLGIVAGITPFNFPVMIALWMAPIALACGNCFILKPSEKDPSPSLLLAQWLTEAGLPDGVFQVLQGDKEIVTNILQHPEISAVSFVGSTPVAKYIYEVASSKGKRVQALGGAKNHLLVCPSADLDQATNALIGAAYGSAGERCMAISVAVVVDSIADQLVAKLKSKCEGLTIGDGSKPGIEMGPLITKEHRDKVSGYITSGVQEGATLVVDGRKKVFDKGFFLGGSLFDHVTSKMKIYKEEIFGPVLCVVRVSTVAEGISFINACQFANGVSIFTKDGAEARLFTQAIQVGMVGVNIPIPVPMPFHSFAGWKESIFGVLGMYGEDGLRFYTRRKAITSRWSHDHQASQFTMPLMAGIINNDKNH